VDAGGPRADDQARLGGSGETISETRGIEVGAALFLAVVGMAVGLIVRGWAFLFPPALTVVAWILIPDSDDVSDEGLAFRVFIGSQLGVTLGLLARWGAEALSRNGR
jgi:hypothetical protein